jgi:DNA/RNA-binding domain of Phe-tRNA-synthetase-like protein
MTPFSVSPECWELGLRAGAIVFRGIRVGPAPPVLRQEIAQEVARVQAHFTDSAQVRTAPELQPFHDVLRKVGVRPRRRPPSVQKLMEFCVERGGLPEINSFVDAYNFVSLQTGLSLGAHDVAQLTFPVELRLFRGNEQFRPLGSGADEPVYPGEFGYIDGTSRVVCRLDSLQADFSKITAATTEALLIIEATASHDQDRVTAAFDLAVDLTLRYCGGQIEQIVRPR